MHANAALVLSVSLMGHTAAQNLHDERVARVIDREVAPLWHDRLARMIWRHLGGESTGLVLDVHCGAGRTTAEIGSGGSKRALSRAQAECVLSGSERAGSNRLLRPSRCGG